MAEGLTARSGASEVGLNRLKVVPQDFCFRDSQYSMTPLQNSRRTVSHSEMERGEYFGG